MYLQAYKFISASSDGNSQQFSVLILKNREMFHKMNGRPHSDIEAVRGQWRIEDRERPISGVRGGDHRASCVAWGGTLVTVSAAFSSAPDVVCNYVQRATACRLELETKVKRRFAKISW